MMGQFRGYFRTAGGWRCASAILMATTALLVPGGASGQTSCVQLSNQDLVAGCPACLVDSDFTFTLTGETLVAANTVNLAIIIDGSSSVNAAGFALSKEFAKDAVDAFADENLFVNGGTASFAQFSNSATTGSTFDSQATFDTFVDAKAQIFGGTNIATGVARGRELLAAAPPSTSDFMIVITDGNGGDPSTEADAARAEGTTVIAVGVGGAPSQSTLLSIAGDAANVYDVDNFSELGDALAGILGATGGTGAVSCPSTGATVSIEFNAVVVAVAVDDALSNAAVGADGRSVVIDVADLEDNPVTFTVVLDLCAEAPGTNVVASVTYADAEGNAPDLTALSGTVPVCPCDTDAICDDPHMQGLHGQSIDWSGVDGGWYSLIKDEDAELHINVRLTAPLPDEFPDRQLITGLSVMAEGHSLVIEVNNPYTIDTNGCPEEVSPCLANGGLSALVDGEDVSDTLRFSRELNLAGGIFRVSSSNLPVECRQFGGDKIWARMYDEMVQGTRSLTAHDVSLEDWILSFPRMAAPDWCVKYISENDLADLQSTHAIFKIETPTVAVRLNAGVNHQGNGELDWDGRVLPALDFWQMDVGMDGLDTTNPALTGILGETARPVYDDKGHAVTEGFEAFRGVVEDYRVSGSLGTHFALLDRKGKDLE